MALPGRCPACTPGCLIPTGLELPKYLVLFKICSYSSHNSLTSISISINKCFVNVHATTDQSQPRSAPIQCGVAKSPGYPSFPRCDWPAAPLPSLDRAILLWGLCYLYQSPCFAWPDTSVHVSCSPHCSHGLILQLSSSECALLRREVRVIRFTQSSCALGPLLAKTPDFH